MSKEFYDLRKSEIEAIPDEETIEPNIPVAIALQEAEDTIEWCKEDEEELIKANLNWDLVEDLPTRVGACRYAQSLWQKEYKTREEAQKEWAELAPNAYRLRNDLVHHLLFGYRNISDLLSKVRAIAEGSGHADMIQDLSDLSVLGKANPAPLTAISLDLTLLDQAAIVSANMAVLLAQSNGEYHSDNKFKKTRDKAYTYVKQVVDEIRRCGQYVFWQNPDREKGYISLYVKQRNIKARNKPNPKV